MASTTYQSPALVLNKKHVAGDDGWRTRSGSILREDKEDGNSVVV